MIIHHAPVTPHFVELVNAYDFTGLVREDDSFENTLQLNIVRTVENTIRETSRSLGQCCNLDGCNYALTNKHNVLITDALFSPAFPRGYANSRRKLLQTIVLYRSNETVTDMRLSVCLLLAARDFFICMRCVNYADAQLIDWFFRHKDCL